ncbi:hypothetical protein Q2T41_19190 [Maribacter confluentis]|uniref:Uncharacterized protein n=1 Tax=Maribacter confluentis TaxID=1656093 RepID=A0ABT8RV30_9FLAO|nr:hypothetical protein [Maribacter confluentis]MDO1514779.1 hypothetical protein [Maribacter confluentis]
MIPNRIKVRFITMVRTGLFILKVDKFIILRLTLQVLQIEY